MSVIKETTMEQNNVKRKAKHITLRASRARSGAGQRPAASLVFPAPKVSGAMLRIGHDLIRATRGTQLGIERD
jgi:hypothetical protein